MDYNHSLMFRPQVLLATLAVPTTAPLGSCVVYFRAVPASLPLRLNRAIGGMRTFTSLALGLTGCFKYQNPRTSCNPQRRVD